jgi:hypothetical protein
MKESTHGRLFTLGVLAMAVVALTVGLWVEAALLIAGLAAHEAAKRWGSTTVGAAPGSGSGITSGAQTPV